MKERLCAFLRLNLSTMDISNITHQSLLRLRLHGQDQERNLGSQIPERTWAPSKPDIGYTPFCFCPLSVLLKTRALWDLVSNLYL